MRLELLAAGHLRRGALWARPADNHSPGRRNGYWDAPERLRQANVSFDDFMNAP
jgi:hypothetical protein